MSIYIVETDDETDYEPGKVLKKAPPKSARSWKTDLRLLDPTTADLTLNVAWNPISEKYEVTYGDSFASFMSLAKAVPPITTLVASDGLLASYGKVSAPFFEDPSFPLIPPTEAVQRND